MRILNKRKRRIAKHQARAQRRTLRAIATLQRDPELWRRMSAVAVGSPLADTLRLQGNDRLIIHAALQTMAKEGKDFENFVPAFCVF